MLSNFYKLIYHIAVLLKNEKWYCYAIQKRLIKKEFSIISNNCWGGSVMEDLNLPYNSPTIGFYFFAPCYITFLTHLKENMKLPVEFVSKSKYTFANEQRKLNWYPIGKIGESELHFVHDKMETEAAEKWYRRRSRINYDQLYIAFSDRDECTPQLMETFDNLPFKNKVFFSSKQISGIKSLIWLKDYRNEPFIGDIYHNRWGYRKYFDVVEWINKPQV